MLLQILAAFMFGLSCSSALAADPAVQIIPRVSQAPQIDGKLDDPCWEQALRLNDFTRIAAPEHARKSIEARLCTDGKSLFIGARLSEPEPGKLKALMTVRNENVWTDDCFEIWIRPT